MQKEKDIHLQLPKERVMDDSTQIRIVKSQSGHANLFVRGVEMHSRFNPVQEAYEQAVELRDKLKKSRQVLILGIGLGYHVQQIEFKMREFHQTPEIVVIEPNEEVALYAQNSHIIPQKFVRVLCGDQVENYYRDRRFVNFLQNKPLIIPHRPTLDLEQSFFKKFLKYEASKKLSKVISVLDTRLVDIFQDSNKEITLYQFLEDLKQSPHLTNTHMQFLAFKKILDSFDNEVTHGK
jgi:hypothetical protein